MATLFVDEWDSTRANYSRGDRVSSQGVGYECLVDNPAAGVAPFDNTNWKLTHIIQVTNIYGIIEAMRLETNKVSNPETANSMLYFAQMGAASYERTVRVPEMLVTRYRTVDANSSVDIPDGMLEPQLLYVNTDEQRPYAISIKRADPTEFRRAELRVGQSSFFVDSSNQLDPSITYLYQVKDGRYEFAPTLPEGMEVGVYGYVVEPRLGSRISLLNDRGFPINSAGQTVAEWVAAGNSADSFVQASRDILTNWFSLSAPDLVIYGGLLKAASWLNESQDKVAQWGALFEQAKAEIDTLVMSHDGGTEEYITLSHNYPA